MTPNSQTKILLIVAAACLLIYLLYRRNEPFEPTTQDSVMNVDHAQINNQLPQDMSKSADNASVDSNEPKMNINEYGARQAAIPKEDMIKYFPQRDYSPPESDWLAQKFNGRNKAKQGEFKRSSYSGSKRGNLGPSDWNDYFDHNNNVVGNSQTGENDNFIPVDESSGNLAVFKTKSRATCGSNQNCEPEDLFDVDKYLPQEVNDDWFEVQAEPISVKNRHLINITKPIGINTIGTSLKNASHDLRGSPACPKFVVAPWLQSSIEPDTNLKPLY